MFILFESEVALFSFGNTGRLSGSGSQSVLCALKWFILRLEVVLKGLAKSGTSLKGVINHYSVAFMLTFVCLFCFVLRMAHLVLFCWANRAVARQCWPSGQEMTACWRGWGSHKSRQRVEREYRAAVANI